MRIYLLSALAALATVCALSAQSNAPVIIPAAGQTAVSNPTTVSVSSIGSGQNLLKMLQEMKTANEETLRKQETELNQLDEIQKVADEIRLYTHRG